MLAINGTTCSAVWHRPAESRICTQKVVQYLMGFKDAKKKFIRALKDGEIQHESRDWGKNWLAEDRIGLEEAVSILSQAQGQDSPGPTLHHFLADVEVWVFKPRHNNERWYIKGYLLEEELHILELHLISFHPSESSQP